MGKTQGQHSRGFRRLASVASLFAGIALASLAVVPIQLKRASPPHAQSEVSASSESSSNSLAPAGSDLLLSSRRLYPYSVIPGGVESVAELRAAVQNDPVVARHYADFDLAKTRVISLDRDRTVYVSYRIGGEVFWTNRALWLHKGEALITDGAHEARTRCGNRISDTAEAPLSSQQPALDAFERVAPEGPLYATNMPIDGELTPPAPYTPAHPFDMQRNEYSPPFFPFVPGPVIGSGPGSIYSNGTGSTGGNGPSSGPGGITGYPSAGGSSSPGSPSVPSSPGSQLTATPEPGTLLLLSMGLSGLFIGRKFRRRERNHP